MIKTLIKLKLLKYALVGGALTAYAANAPPTNAYFNNFNLINVLIMIKYHIFLIRN